MYSIGGRHTYLIMSLRFWEGSGLMVNTEEDLMLHTELMVD